MTLPDYWGYILKATPEQRQEAAQAIDGWIAMGLPWPIIGMPGLAEEARAELRRNERP